jgi:hypothetical protein
MASYLSYDTHELLKLTTSVLTTTILEYAIGAGITAAAGTRLALQLLLFQNFNLKPFRIF